MPPPRAGEWRVAGNRAERLRPARITQGFVQTLEPHGEELGIVGGELLPFLVPRALRAGKIATWGHAISHAPQSMHSVGLM